MSTSDDTPAPAPAPAGEAPTTEVPPAPFVPTAPVAPPPGPDAAAADGEPTPAPAFPAYGAYTPAPVEPQAPGDPVRGLLAGAGVAVAGAIAWGLVVYLTKYEIGLLAVAVGYAVGWTVHRVGRVASQSTAAIAAVLAAAGILLGFVITTVAAIAAAFDLGFFETVSRINDTGSWGAAFSDSVTGTDWLFLAIGAFSAYSLVARSRTQRRR